MTTAVHIPHDGREISRFLIKILEIASTKSPPNLAYGSSSNNNSEH